MRNSRLVLVMCLMGLWATCARGEIYTVPLDGLKGVYSTGDIAPVGKSIPFDFGLPFVRIDNVQVQLKGTIAPGLWSIHSLVGGPADDRVEIFSALGVFVHDPGDYTVGGAGGLREDGAFDTILGLSRFFNADWGFLKDGRGDVDFQLWGPGFTDDVVETQIVPCVAGISEAALVVEGQAVPEPSGTLMFILVSSAVLMLTRMWRTWYHPEEKHRSRNARASCAFVTS